MTTQLNVKSLQIAVLACTLSLLSACGYHLRGTLDVAADKAQLSLQSEHADPMLRHALHRSMKDNSIQQNAASSNLLTIQNCRFERDSVSLDRSARVDEYSLTLKVRYTLKDIDDNAEKTVTALVERVYSYDADAAAAKDEQESLLRQEMYNAMATRIMRSYLMFDAPK